MKSRLRGRVMCQSPDFPVQTKRVILAHVSVCRGCCCGAVDKGKPEVPVGWMRDEWKKRGLKKSIQLTISGCLGPCDLSNVVSISSATDTVWLGTLREFRDYAALVEWVTASRGAGRVLPLPEELSEFRFTPFRIADSDAVRVQSATVELRHMHSNDTTQPVCFLEVDPQLSLLKRGAAEFTGTLLLMLVLIGTKLSALHSPVANGDASGLAGGVVGGGALAGLILALGAISGGHFNPLITILQWISRLRPGICAAVYVAAQLAGGVCGGILATTAVGTMSDSGGPRSPGHGWVLAELMSSAGLMVVVFGCMRSGRREFGSVGIGAWLTASTIALPATFANPALALGTKLALGTDALTWSALQLTSLMEIAGAFMAAAVLGLLFPKELRVSRPASGTSDAERLAASS